MSRYVPVYMTPEIFERWDKVAKSYGLTSREMIEYLTSRHLLVFESLLRLENKG